MSLSFALRRDPSQVIYLSSLVTAQLEKSKSASTENSNQVEFPTIKIGTKEDCDVRIRNTGTESRLYGLISRHHCRLEVRDHALVLFDGVRVWLARDGREIRTAAT